MLDRSTPNLFQPDARAANTDSASRSPDPERTTSAEPHPYQQAIPAGDRVPEKERHLPPSPRRARALASQARLRVSHMLGGQLSSRRLSLRRLRPYVLPALLAVLLWTRPAGQDRSHVAKATAPRAPVVAWSTVSATGDLIREAKHAVAPHRGRRIPRPAQVLSSPRPRASGAQRVSLTPRRVVSPPAVSTRVSPAAPELRRRSLRGGGSPTRTSVHSARRSRGPGVGFE